MTRPPFEVADIIRAHGKNFVDHNRSWLRGGHLKVLSAIERCRTAALGGHRDRCTTCGYETISYSFNSCRNRHCPKCQTNAREKWLAKRSTDLLPVAYVHVVFTLPHLLVPLALAEPHVFIQRRIPLQPIFVVEQMRVFFRHNGPRLPVRRRSGRHRSRDYDATTSTCNWLR